jgi:L-ascorbate metabolism protein UlaG (beta-lactamase superfamily)
MELRFNGHACVTLRAQDGRVVVTDPYRPGAFGGKLCHAPVQEMTDVVTVSHYHIDHSHVTSDLCSQNGVLPTIVDRSAQAEGFSFQMRTTYHDRVGGTRMGLTQMMVVEMDGLRVAHLGDIGCPLTPADVKALGPIDVLLWPVGDVYTLGPEDAPQVLEALSPKIAIPLHFEHERCQIGMKPVDALLPHVRHLTVKRAGASHWSSRDGLPDKTQVLVLEPAL